MHTIPSQHRLSEEEAAKLSAIGMNPRFSEGVLCPPLPPMQGAGEAAQRMIAPYNKVVATAQHYPQQLLQVKARQELSESGKRAEIAKILAAASADLADVTRGTQGARVTLGTLKADLERLATAPPADAWEAARLRDVYLELDDSGDGDEEIAVALAAEDWLTIKAVVVSPRSFHLVDDDTRTKLTASLFKLLNPTATESVDRLEGVIQIVEFCVNSVQADLDHQAQPWGSADGPLPGYGR